MAPLGGVSNDKTAAHLRGIEGKANPSTGKVTRTGCKAVVVFQPYESDEPVPYGYFASEEDARDYIKSMRVSGAAQGLRVVKPSDVENGGDN